MPDIITITPWARDLLVRQKCPFCKTAYREEDVCASGNRRNKDGKAFYFYEVECNRCKNPAMSLVTSRPCDTYQLGIYCIQLHAQMKEEGADSRPYIWALFPKLLFNGEVSKITDEELLMAKNIINDSESHIDFLRKIGLTQDEIDKYAQPGGGQDEGK